MTLDAVVTDIKKHEQNFQSSNPFLYGFALRTFEQESPLHGNIIGVQVVGASENSAGWRAGLRPGDIIISANKSRLLTLNLYKKLRNRKNKSYWRKFYVDQALCIC